jgi:hypothetical protein
MTTGLKWKRNAEEILARRRRFFRREMQDSILVTFAEVAIDNSREWQAFDKKWGQRQEGEARPFPSNEEIFERETINLKKRGAVEDDWLPVSYSTLDLGESMVSGMFGAEMNFIHRPHGPAVSVPCHLLPDYAQLSALKFSLDNTWARHMLSIQKHFAEHGDGQFAQHPFLIMDALNFACEMRGATQVYLDINEHPEELKQLMEIGLDFCLRLQEAQAALTGTYADGSFNWLGQWVPFDQSVSLSVDAYVICSPQHYVEFGFDFQRRLLEHFGHGLVHFHCNRTDLAREVAKLPHLELFQYGGDPHDPRPDLDYLPEMRAILGPVPIMVYCGLDIFTQRLKSGELLPNVWYVVGGEKISTDEANRLMDRVRKYRHG